MDYASMLWLLAVSVAASALGGMLGIASGIFIVPILATENLREADIPISRICLGIEK